MSDEMERDYRRYMADKHVLDDARRGLENLRASVAYTRLSPAVRSEIPGVLAGLKAASDHIVAVWD